MKEFPARAVMLPLWFSQAVELLTTLQCSNQQPLTVFYSTGNRQMFLKKLYQKQLPRLGPFNNDDISFSIAFYSLFLSQVQLLVVLLSTSA